MKTVIVYPVPMDNEEVWELFKPFITRFTDSLRAFPPGCEYDLWVVTNRPVPDETPLHWLDWAVNSFNGLKPMWMNYTGSGADIGSLQTYVNSCQENEFVVFCNTRVYAHREGWLKRLVDARETFGPGLYATSVSREGGKLHACGRCFGVDSDDFKEYPHVIDSRDKGHFFEIGDGCFMEWFLSIGRNRNLVQFDGITHSEKHPLVNGYRSGNQSNVLVWDKHTQYYAHSDSAEKTRLEKMCFEGHE